MAIQVARISLAVGSVFMCVPLFRTQLTQHCAEPASQHYCVSVHSATEVGVGVRWGGGGY